LQGKAPKEIHDTLTETLEYAPSYAIVKNWVTLLKRCDFSTCDAPRSGRPKTVTNPEIINQIHELILEERRISAESIAEQMGVTRERIGPSFMKVWRCGTLREVGAEMTERRLKTSPVPVV